MSGQQIVNAKYRNWVKAGLGLKYLKEGLEPFCDDIVKQQHVHLLNNVKQKHNLTIVNCGLCSLRTLQSDHVRTKYKQCPLGQKLCNCQYPGGRFLCPNNVCGAIYDEIIKHHASTPPAPYWRNTDVQLWCTEPWAVATCFINAPGYTQKLTASEIDCSGLLHLLINNKHLQSHINCKITGTDVFSMVRQHRNTIFHCENMELEDTEVDTYIDDMIDALQDSKELNHRNESKAAVKKLLQLKQHDFIITTSLEAEVKAARASFKDLQDELKRKLKAEVEQKGEEIKAELVQKGSDIKSEMEQKGSYIKAELEQKGLGIIVEVEHKGLNIEADVEKKGSDIRAEMEQSLLYIKADMEQKGSDITAEIKQKVSNINAAVDQKGSDIKAQLEHKGSDIRVQMEQKGSDIRAQMEQKGSEIRAQIEQKESDIGAWMEQNGSDIRAQMEQEESDIRAQMEQKESDIRAQLEQKGSDIRAQMERKESDIRAQMEQKGSDIRVEVEQKGSDMKTEIKQIGSDIKTDLEKKGNDLKIEIQESFSHCAESAQERKYSEMKKEYQKKLMQDYMQYAMQVSALPLQPESNHTGIENVYVSPLITVDIWNEKSRETEEVPTSVDGMFHNVEKPARNIYVLGDAGSGKTTLCKMLVYYWCVAHTEREARTSESSAVKVMENYDFLFYVSLRHNSDLNKIEIMLDEIYPDPVLRTILQNESDKCLILLDGLDEWTAQNQRTSQFLTSGLPTRDLHAKYTIITTTRRWKFDTLRIKDSEIDNKIKLKGIGGTAVRELTKATVRTLNKTFHKNKVADDFLPALKKSPVADVSHVPMILQQLICLWFDDRLRGNSKCAIYSSMLDLYFDWNALKLSNKQKVMVPLEHKKFPGLPAYFNEYQACFHNTNAIYHLSHLAYKTLFDRHKENTLTFSNSNFQQLNIPGDMITLSLKVGILSEDQNKNVFASRRQHTSFSFVHKSLQEFLAAVYVAIQFEKMIQTLDDKQKSTDVWLEYCEQFVRDHFGKCKTVTDILEQSNILIMLCGVESQLLPFISEYIYTITTADKQITEERKITKDDLFGHQNVLQNDIQKCIVSCVSEALSSGNQFKNSVYIADIVLDPTHDVHVVSHRQIFNLHRVLSVDIYRPRYRSIQDRENMFSVLKLVTECESLKTFKYSGSPSALSEAADTIEGIEQQTAEIIARNKSTLETVSFNFASERMMNNLVLRMPTMYHVTSFRVSDVIVSHEVCRSLCTILEQSVHLQQIYLDIICNKLDEHSINLTKHNQLQYLDLHWGSINASSVNTECLDTCRLKVSSSLVVCKSLYDARRLKHLRLNGCPTTRNSDARTNTDYLVRLLPTLTSLSTVELWDFTFTDNIITRPSDMRNLQKIQLQSVTMSMTTWCAFVNSLPALPQTVCVRAFDMTIEDIRSPLYREGTRYLLNVGRRDEAAREAALAAREVALAALAAREAALAAREEALAAREVALAALAAREAALEAARQYIREKPESFRVTKDDVMSFIFVTKEAGL